MERRKKIKTLFEHEAEHYNRRLGFRGKLLTGFEHPERECKPQSDEPKLSCPYARIIRKYSKPLARLVTIPVPCGHCTLCKHHSQNALIFRLFNHAKMYKHCVFVTLTYNDEHYTENVEELKDDITKFIKRFRKAFDDRTMSYYMVCERGDLFNRCHFHLLLFWNGDSDYLRVCSLIQIKWMSKPRNSTPVQEEIAEAFGISPFITPIGFTYFEDVVGENGQISTEIMAYVSKYVSDNVKKLVFRSWSLGLGRDILSTDPDLVNKMIHHKVIQYMPKDKVYSVAVPTYYKDKLFSQSEKDVMFNDYLVSSDYTDFMRICTDENLRRQIFDSYLAYEKRCLERYEARKQLKKQRKRLL